MSATLTTRRRPSPTRKAGAPDPISEAGKPRVIAGRKYSRPEEEPLEHSIQATEAPESRQASHREAPDAGQGESHFLGAEFTHGRSRS
jgi:hypothetical protein